MLPNAEIQKILAEIDEKKKRADELALEFRRLYQESQEAYADGDGELAKELSEEGHEAQDECEALNEEVADLYRELRDLKRQTARISVLPQTALQGMPVSFQKAVTDTLNTLPARHVSAKLIERVSYSDRYIVGSSGNPIQANTNFNKVTGKATIVINRQTPTGFKSLGNVEIATAHEVGHVVYREILTDRQKANWNSNFNHPKGPEESFAESYRYYYLNREKLAKDFPLAKIFFDQLNLE